MWNPRTLTRSYRTSILLDTGAGGGNYASAKFIKAVQCHVYSNLPIVSKRGRGFLRTANPTDSSDVTSISIVGTTVLPLVFPPVDRVFRTRVRIVDKLPIGFILGAACMRHYSSSIIFEGTGLFQPAKDSPGVPLLPSAVSRSPRPWNENVHHVQRGDDPRQGRNWRAATMAVRSGRVRDSETEEIMTPPEDEKPTSPAPPTPEEFCAVEWCTWEPDNTLARPAEVAAAQALDLGSMAWEDSGSLTWPVVMAQRQGVPGRVSVEVDTRLLGPQPHTAQLLLVLPLRPFDLEQNPDISVAKGVQWWAPGTAPKVKLVNRTTSPKYVDEGVQLASAYATNCDDVERMLLLKVSVPPALKPEPRRRRRSLQSQHRKRLRSQTQAFECVKPTLDNSAITAAVSSCGF